MHRGHSSRTLGPGIVPADLIRVPDGHPPPDLHSRTFWAAGLASGHIDAKANNRLQLDGVYKERSRPRTGWHAGGDALRRPERSMGLGAQRPHQRRRHEQAAADRRSPSESCARSPPLSAPTSSRTWAHLPGRDGGTHPGRLPACHRSRSAGLRSFRQPAPGSWSAPSRHRG
jgi:hypothetical protein